MWPQELHLSPSLILHLGFSLLELLKFLWFLIQELHPYFSGEIIYKSNMIICTPTDATSEGLHASVCTRSNKPLVLITEVVKATLDCLPIMQNLHRLSLQCLMPGRTPLLCRARNLARSCVQDACAKALQCPLSLLLRKRHAVTNHHASDYLIQVRCTLCF